MQAEPGLSATERKHADRAKIDEKPEKTDKLLSREKKDTADDRPTPQTWPQYQAFYDICEALSTADTLDDLLQLLMEQLQAAISGAQRGAVLLPDEQEELLLKAHWPPGDHSVSKTCTNRAFSDREAFIWQAPEHRTPGDTHSSALYYRIKSAIYVPLLYVERAYGVIYVDNYDKRDAFSESDLTLLKAVARQAAMIIKDKHLQDNLQRQQALRSDLLRQFSPKVAEQMFEESARLQVGGERVDPVTVLITDVRGFTALSAKMEPGDVVRMLNEMFYAFVPIIFENDGVVDKYIGDSVLAVFGSPKRDNKQWIKAVRAAHQMQQAMHELGGGWKVRRLPVFEVGIGIHSGPVIHGFIGSAERMEYTVIGATVNRAARYCDGAGRGEVFISKAVYERVYGLIEVKPKTNKSKHPETEDDLIGYVVKKLKE
ncbi:MAG: GAF domain-containing protein [Planctomycetes bacterium]|nr:GAF domain-containing protein [Planctomycetota bacterium]